MRNVIFAFTIILLLVTFPLLFGCKAQKKASTTPGMTVQETSAGTPNTNTTSDWPQFRGVKADGFSSEVGVNKDWTKKAPAVLWTVPMSDNGYSGPAVAAGVLYIIDHQGKQDVLRALNLSNGKDLWNYKYDDTESANNGFARSTPTIDHENLYILSRLGLISCLEKTTGKLRWSRDIITDFQGRRPPWDLGMSPFIDGNKLILCPGGPNAAVVALDKTTGKTLWQGGGSDQPGYATPVVATLDGKRQYVIFTAYHLLGVDANNGKLLWQVDWITGSDVNAATPIVVGNKIFITTDYNHGCALVAVNGSQAHIVWQNTEMQAHFSTPIYQDGYLYGTGEPGFLTCLEFNTGKARWKQAGFEKGGVLGVDGTLIAGCGSTGDIVMVKLTPERYQETGSHQTLRWSNLDRPHHRRW